MRRLIVVLWLAASGCTALTRFDDEGQACELNAPADQRCLPGFECQLAGDAGVCRRLDAGTP